MKIAYFVGNYGLVSETFITDLIQGLSSKGNTVNIFCNQLHDKQVNLLHPHIIKEVKFLVPNSIISRTLSKVKSLGPNGGDRNKLFLLRHAYRVVKPILSSLNTDIAYIDYGTTAVPIQAALSDVKVPFVVHFHGADITKSLNDCFYRSQLPKLFENATVLIAPSQHIRRLLILEGAPEHKVQVVHPAPNIEGIKPLSWDKRKTLSPSVIFLGRLTSKKNPVALIEAFRLVKQKVPNARLSIIGDGPEMDRVQKRIHQYHLNPSVKLYGELPRENALEIMNKHWVLAQHSVTSFDGDQEGFPVSLTEAASLGLPIVSTIHSGIPEQVIQGETGLLVHEYDFEEMANKIIFLLLEPEQAKAMGEKASKEIENISSKKIRTEKINNILSSSMFENHAK